MMNQFYPNNGTGGLNWREENSSSLSAASSSISSYAYLANRARPRLQIIGSPRGAAEKFDENRVIGFAFF